MSKQFIQQDDRSKGKELVKEGLELIFPFGPEAEEIGETLLNIHDHLAYGMILYEEHKARLYYIHDLGWLISD